MSPVSLNLVNPEFKIGMKRISIHIALLLLASVGLPLGACADDISFSGAAAPGASDTRTEKNGSLAPAQVKTVPLQKAIILSQNGIAPIPDNAAMTQNGAAATPSQTDAGAAPPPSPAPESEAIQTGTTPESPGTEAGAGGELSIPALPTEAARAAPGHNPPGMANRPAEQKVPVPLAIKKSPLPYPVITVLIFDVLSFFVHVW